MGRNSKTEADVEERIVEMIKERRWTPESIQEATTLLKQKKNYVGGGKSIEIKRTTWGSGAEKKVFFTNNLLHVGMLYDAPLEIIQIIMDRYPKSATSSKLSGCNWTLLHSGMDGAARPETIALLLEEYPKAAKVKDTEGRVPLHLGMYMRAPLASIAAVLEAYPEGAEIIDNDGYTPLHSGLELFYPSAKDAQINAPWSSKKVSVEALKLVMDAYPKAVGIQDKIGHRTVLHLAMRVRLPLELAMAMVQHCPQALELRDNEGKTPLFVGLEHGMPVEVLLFIIRSYPATMKATLANGRTILHQMMGKDAYDGAVRAFIRTRKYLELDRMAKDDNGQTPLHLAMIHKASPKTVEVMLLKCPKSAEVIDRNGQTALFLGIAHGASIDAIRIVLKAYPFAANYQNGDGDTPLHICSSSKVSPDIITEILQLFPNAANVLDKNGRTPLQRYIQENAPVGMLLEFLRNCPDAAKAKDREGNTPLHLLVKKSTTDNSTIHSVAAMRAILQICPAAFKIRDRDGNTPLLSLTLELYDKPGDPKEGNKSGCRRERGIQLFKALCDACPQAAEIENDWGTSPIRILIQLLTLAIGKNHTREIHILSQLVKSLMRGLRDGRALKNLCNLERPRSVEVLLALFASSSRNSENTEDNSTLTTIDLNQKVLPGWTFLEILADLDNDDSADMLLQLVVDNRQDSRKHDNNHLLTIVCNDDDRTVLEFCVSCEASEETMTKVADRAKLCLSSDRLKSWGQVYGRFLNEYMIDKRKKPKHISETCVVVFASTTRTEEDGQLYEGQVALKFLRSIDAFCREIEKRTLVNTKGGTDGKASKYVVPILAAYTSLEESQMDPLQLEKLSSVRVQYATNLDKELLAYPSILASADGHIHDIKFLLVMDSGSGLDLHDVISHQNIAGRNLPMVLSIATCIAECLEFLNETCHVLHGDVKARNFILGIGAEYLAIDLDNAASIAHGEAVGNKRTSSGYLPPEQAAIEAWRRRHDGGTYRSTQSTLEVEMEGLERELQKAYQVENYEEQLILLKAHREAKEKLKPMRGEGAYQARASFVAATPQQDMWCFGVLLYYLCTGEQLFSMDLREEVKDSELAKIQSWNKELMLSKLALVPKKWPRGLLADLLQPNPANRPSSWASIMQQLRSVQEDPSKFRVAPKSSPSMWALSYWQLMELEERLSQDFGSAFARMTMRDINEKVIAPRCREAGSSYALACNPDGLMLDAFVTHSWDEPFHDFVTSIRKVFQTTVTKPNLWICAFALNQSNRDTIAAQVGSEDSPLSNSPFVKALEHALTFVVVRNSTTDLYTRLWCVCELIFAKKLGLVPNKTHVTGADVFSHLRTSCLDADCTNAKDRDRILKVLLQEHNAEEIDRIVQLFRTQETPE